MKSTYISACAMVAALSIWLALTASAAMQDSRMKAIDPTAVFGPAQLPILLRIDSDEFGADGLLDALAEDFMSQHHFHGRIAWYQDSDANGIVQLRRGNVDVAVVADTRFLADQEMPLALDIAHTHLVLVGPAANPAHIDIEDSSVAALRKIAGFGSRRAAEGGAPVFLSRDDRSANTLQERDLWMWAGLHPWITRELWYRNSHVFARPSLRDADHEALYTWVDLATWRAMRPHVPGLRCYVSSGQDLTHPELLVVRPYPANRVRVFVTYMGSRRAQNIIARYQR